MSIDRAKASSVDGCSMSVMRGSIGNRLHASLDFRREMTSGVRLYWEHLIKVSGSAIRSCDSYGTLHRPSCFIYTIVQMSTLAARELI